MNYDINKSIELFSHGLQESKEKYWAYFRLAVNIFNDQKEPACHIFNQISKDNDVLSKIQLLIANFLFSKKQYNLAQPIYDRYFEACPNSISVFLKIIICLYQQGHDEKTRLLIEEGQRYFDISKNFFYHFLRN